MGKKILKLPFLSKNSSSSSSSIDYSRSWPWPTYCQQPKTLSFRNSDTVFKTLNSAYFEANLDLGDQNTESCEEESPSLCTTSAESGIESSIETVIRGLRRSDRLFFKPGETSSILEEAKEEEEENKDLPFKESVVMSLDSQDPFLDFKESMEEMVQAHGLRDWDSLEELLCCFLKVNSKNNHEFIIGAFVDLLVGFAFASATVAATATATTVDSQCFSRSNSSPLSFYTSSNFSDDSSSTPCISSLEPDDEEIHLTPCSSNLFEAQNEIKED